MADTKTKRTIVVTVGTALLTNTGWRKRVDGADMPLPTDAALFNTLDKAGLTKASAETNTLDQMMRADPPGVDAVHDTLVWLHSETPEGTLCAKVLDTYFHDRFQFASSLHQIDGLNYDDPAFADQGLRSLVSTTMRVVTEAGGAEHVIFCATGGFKAEIAYLNLIGALLGIEVYYLHELFRTLIVLPRLPLTWRVDVVVEHLEFFTRVHEKDGYSSDELGRYVDGHEGLRPYLAQLLTEKRGRYYLSPAGELLYEISQYTNRHS